MNPNKKAAIDLTKADKAKLISEDQKVKLSAKQQWYIYRNAAKDKAEKLSSELVLQAILIVLVKIYWELRKP